MGGGTGASLVKGWASIPEGYVTQVPILSLDRILGGALCGKRALILVDIEGAEWMMLQGAANTLVNESRPFWMIEISGAAHQPAGTNFNPHFQATFEMFFDRGYRAYMADSSGREIRRADLDEIVANRIELNVNNFVFR